MYTVPFAITLLALLAHFVEGFRPILNPARIAIRVNVVKDDYPARRNTFAELVRAFIEAIPSVLKPPREMDKSKVINDPPKFIKASAYQLYCPSILSHPNSQSYNEQFDDRLHLPQDSAKRTKGRVNGQNKRRSTISLLSTSHPMKTVICWKNP